MTAGTVSSVVSEVQAGANTVLGLLEEFDPAAEVPAAAAEGIVNEVSSLVTTALSAWSAASGIPITVQSVIALLPEATPLTEPDPA